MGTRGTLGVRISGEDKLSYNHWDSYPDGLGMDVLNDVRGMMAEWGIEKMIEQATKLKLVDSETPPTKDEIKSLEGFADLGVSSQDENEWYVLLRELQGKLRDTLTVGYATEGNSFIYDSLFCEYGYILNLDEKVLEVYVGFQKPGHDYGRYSDTSQADVGALSGNSDYGPCALVATFPLDDLPTDEDFMIAIHRGNFETESAMVLDYFGEYGDTLTIDEVKKHFGIDKKSYQKVIDDLRESGHEIEFFPGEVESDSSFGLKEKDDV